MFVALIPLWRTNFDTVIERDQVSRSKNQDLKSRTRVKKPIKRVSVKISPYAPSAPTLALSTSHGATPDVALRGAVAAATPAGRWAFPTVIERAQFPPS